MLRMSAEANTDPGPPARAASPVYQAAASWARVHAEELHTIVHKHGGNKPQRWVGTAQAPAHLVCQRSRCTRRADLYQTHRHTPPCHTHPCDSSHPWKPLFQCIQAFTESSPTQRCVQKPSTNGYARRTYEHARRRAHAEVHTCLGAGTQLFVRIRRYSRLHICARRLGNPRTHAWSCPWTQCTLTCIHRYTRVSLHSYLPMKDFHEALSHIPADTHTQMHICTLH